MAIKLVRRSAWGAPSSSAASYIASTKGVKVHYLGSPYSSRAHSKCDDYVRAVRAEHLANKAENYSDIAYNMLVCEHGYVYEGRGAHKKTGANGNSTLNAGHYAVCALLGSSGLTKPTDAMLGGIRDAIEWLRKNGSAGSEIKGHRDGYATTCPGSALYAWVKKGAPRPGGTSTPAPSKPATITPKSREAAATMKAQAAKALKAWPFIADVEKAHGLTAGLLLAVGSRETSLRNVIGDGGHGFGVWQRDNRWWNVDKTYLNDVKKQATDAATLLAANHKALGSWPAAVAAYNAGLTGVRNAVAAGKSPDSVTTGGDYAADVLGRQIQMKGTTPAPKPPATPTVDLSKLVAAAKSDPAKSGHPVSYSGAKTVEKALKAEGLLSSVYVDGHFGTQTKAAYAAWQRKLGYSGSAADGIPGSASLKKLGAKHGFVVVA